MVKQKWLVFFFINFMLTIFGGQLCQSKDFHMGGEPELFLLKVRGIDYKNIGSKCELLSFQRENVNAKKQGSGNEGTKDDIIGELDEEKEELFKSINENNGRDDEIKRLKSQIAKLKEENDRLVRFASASRQILEGAHLLFSFENDLRKNEFLKILGQIKTDLFDGNQPIAVLGTYTELRFVNDPMSLQCASHSSVFLPPGDWVSNSAFCLVASASRQILKGAHLLFFFESDTEKEEFVRIIQKFETDLRSWNQNFPLIATISQGLGTKNVLLNPEPIRSKSVFFPRWNRVASSTFFLVNLEEIQRMAKFTKKVKEIMVFYTPIGDDFWLIQGGKAGRDLFGNCTSLVNPKWAYQIPGLSLIILIPYQATGTPVFENFRKFLAGEVFP